MNRLFRSAVALGGLVAFLAVPASAQEVELKPEKKPKPDKYLITAEEIGERADLTNAMDAVKRLRSSWLKPVRPKGSLSMGHEAPVRPPPDCRIGDSRPECSGQSSGSGGGVVVQGDAYGGAGAAAKSGGILPVLYIDEVRQESVDEMENVRVGAIVEIRLLTGNVAAGRYGAGHEAGAIMLKTNRMGYKP